ncbi:MAG: DUF3422 family protein [Pseudomonadota bacterium]
MALKDLRGMMKIDDRAALYSFEAHDRPAPPLHAPCITFGFSLRPRPHQDPIEAEDEASVRVRNKAWLDAVNRVLKAFEDERFRPAGAVPAGQFSMTKGAAASEGEAKRFRLFAKNIRIRWTNRGADGAPLWTLPGYVVIDQQEEYTSFLFTLSLLERDPPRMASGETPAPLPSAMEAPEGSPPRLLFEALKTLTMRERGAELGGDWRLLDAIGPAQLDAIEAARECALEELWNAFMRDLDDAWRRPDDPADAAVFPGEAFSALKGVVVREDAQWQTADDQRADVLTYSDAEAFDALESRRAVLRNYFDDARNREYIGSLVVNRQAIYVSTLGSTQIEPGAEAASETGDTGKAADFEPTRYFLLIRNRPDAPQLGRMVERIHALESLRIASVIDIDDLRDVGADLRHLGARLDKLMTEKRTDRDDGLSKILGRISEHGVDVRGGVSYRISRGSLYADAFMRRLQELRADPIETWQPYEEFVKRRLKETFEFIKEIDDRRDFLFTRVQLLVQRNMERETTQSLNSTDRLSRIAAVAAPTAVGVSMGDAITKLAPIWTNLLPPEAQSPTVLAQLDGATVGLLLGVAIALLLSVRWSRPQ